MKNIIKSTLLASTIAIGLKFFINKNPIYSIDASLKIPFLSYIEIKPINCVAMGVNWNREENTTIYTFGSRSISKNFAEKCINKGIIFIENQLLKEEKKTEKIYYEFINEYKKIASEIEENATLNEKTLNLIARYSQLFLKIKKYEYMNSNLLNKDVDNIKLNINTSIYKNSWRYSLIVFLLSFWLFFASFEYFKNEK